MIWSVVVWSVGLVLLLELRKDGCGGILRARRVRAAVDLWRTPVNAARRQHETAGRVAMASIFDKLLSKRRRFVCRVSVKV